MSNNIILSYPNRATAATITGGSWSASLPAQNVANKEMWKVARSTDATLASTKFTADLGAAKQVRCIALANHNLSAVAQVLVKVMGESGNPNLLTYSEQFDNAIWGKINTTVTANATTGPDGAVTADKLVENTVNGEHYFDPALTVTSGVAYALSIFVKAAELTKVRLRTVVNFPDLATVFDLSLGAVSSSTHGAGNSGVMPMGNGWYRCWVIGTASGTGSGVARVQLVTDAGAVSYVGDGSSGLFVWGEQLEVGAFPTTYKPTTSTPSNIALHYSSGWQPAWRMAFDNLVEWESATWWTGTAGDEYLRSPYAVTAVADDIYSARYITIEVNDTANVDGYVQVGRLFVGSALQPTYNPSYGLQDGLRELSTTDAAESGASWGTERRRLRYTSFVLSWVTPEDAAYLHEMQRSLGIIGEVLYIPYPADPGESQRWGFIGRMSELSPIDYPHHRVRSLPLKLEEIA